jgi:putative ABC transport system permease protein
VIRLALRSLAARPLRTALTTLAIVLGVALVSGALTLTDTQRRAADALSAASYDGTAAVVSAKTAFETDASQDWALQRPTIDAAKLAEVRRTPGVGAAVGDVTDLNAKIIDDRGEPVGSGPYFGIGFDAGTPGAERLTPLRVVDGRWAARDGEVVIDQKTAEDQGWTVGDRVRISGRGEARPFEVVGIARFGAVKSIGPATVAVFALETAQRLFDRGSGYDSILVAAGDGVPAADVRASLTRALGDSATVKTAVDDDRFTFDGLGDFISVIRIVLLAFGFVAVLVGALTIVNSLSITVAQRTRELALLRLVGASRRQVMGSVVAEAAGIGILGSIAGLGAGYLVAKGLQGLFTSLGLDLPEAGTVFDGGTVVTGLLVGTVVTLVAGIVPALRATRVAPVVALRDAGEGSRRAGLAGRAIRPLISLLGRPAERLGGAAGLLARRNALRRPGRTAATAGALTVGVALVTVLAIMAAGLRDTTTTTALSERVHGTHVLIGSDGWSPTDPKAAGALRDVPGVKAVTTIRQDVGHAFGDNERVNTVEGDRLGFDVVAGVGTTAELGRDGAIVDEGWATEHGLEVGDRFEVLSPAGDRLGLEVKGIERSSVMDPVDLGPITIAPDRYAEAFRQERSHAAVVDAPGVDAAALERALAPFPDADVHTTAAFTDMRLGDIDTLMAIFVVLLALAVIVSLFGIVNALVLAAFERRRELGMLQAVGMTRRQVRRMVRHESIVTALLGAATGVVAGLGLGAVVTSLLSEQGLTYVVPTGTIVVLAVVAVLAGILAAIVPARRAARLSPLTALAYE